MKTRLNIFLSNAFDKSISIFIIALIVFVVVSVWNNYANYKKIGGKIKQKENAVAELQKENEDLKKRIDEVKTSEYVEEQIRDKLGLAKEGEVVIIMPDEATIRRYAIKHTEENLTLPEPNWKRWFKLFGL